MPQRIKIMRTRGWELPANTVDVSLGKRWGNPYRIAPQQADNPYSSAHDAAARFRDDLMLGKLVRTQAEAVAELAGKDLACRCDLTMPCHADFLLEIANAATEEIPPG